MKLFSTLAVLAVATSVMAQGHIGQEDLTGMVAIKPLIGTWVGKTTFNTGRGTPIVLDTSLKITRAIQGHYLKQEQVTINPMTGAADTMNFLTYDRRTGLYKAWWFFDAANNEPVRVQGHLQGKTLVLMSPDVNPQFHDPVFRRTINFESSNALSDKLELKQGDSWRTLFVTNYTRKQS